MFTQSQSENCYNRKTQGLNRINYRGTGIPIQTNRKALRRQGVSLFILSVLKITSFRQNK